ncbi:MAG: glutamine-hydrolyzing GMP synthase, partial [Candidatus Hydrogenedentes bacterium]|nr:glutamine-hydrolyzing GMP synthase [Candidatus Hydrogenedentota bacterium]
MQGVGNPIVVLDFGAQYSKLIARRVREAKVYSLILPFNTPIEELKALDPAGIIFSGGPASVHASGAPKPDPAIFDLGVPVLGICYGVQTMCEQLGGEIEGSKGREFGRAEINIVDDCLIFSGVWEKGSNDHVWMSHGDKIKRIPEGFRTVGVSEN